MFFENAALRSNRTVRHLAQDLIAASLCHCGAQAVEGEIDWRGSEPKITGAVCARHRQQRQDTRATLEARLLEASR